MHKINTENSLWSLEPGSCVLVCRPTSAHRGCLWKGCVPEAALVTLTLHAWRADALCIGKGFIERPLSKAVTLQAFTECWVLRHGGGGAGPMSYIPHPDIRSLQLSLSKSGEVWWSAVLKGEAEIDVNQINRERSMATVDEEEHAVLDRLTFDYHQKLQGKPQSHEMVRICACTLLEQCFPNWSWGGSTNSPRFCSHWEQKYRVAVGHRGLEMGNTVIIGGKFGSLPMSLCFCSYVKEPVDKGVNMCIYIVMLIWACLCCRRCMRC